MDKKLCEEGDVGAVPVLTIGKFAEIIWHQGGPCQLAPGDKLYLHPPAQAAQADVKCSDCLGYGENCLAGHSAHPRNWHKCETCGGSGKAPTAEPVAQDGPEEEDGPWADGWDKRSGTKESPTAQPRAVPDGTWLWGKLMDWCKARGYAPATMDDLFAISGEAHKLFSAAPSPGESA